MVSLIVRGENESRNCAFTNITYDSLWLYKNVIAVIVVPFAVS